MERSNGGLLGVRQQERRSYMKKLILAAAFVVAATSASLAQGIYVGPGYGTGYYNEAPGYSGNYAPRYGYRGDYNHYGYSSRDDERGGPGPRVGAGGGMGVGSQR